MAALEHGEALVAQVVTIDELPVASHVVEHLVGVGVDVGVGV